MLLIIYSLPLIQPILYSSIFLLIFILILFNTPIYQKIKDIIHLHKLPGPKRYPILGNVLEAWNDEVVIFKKCRQWAEQFSPTYVLIGYPYCLVNFTRPQEIETMISTMAYSKKSKIYELVHVWLGQGLLTSDGEKWQQRRKLINSAFHVNLLQAFIGVFCKQSGKLVEQFENLTQAESAIIDVVPPLNHFAISSIKETIMGTSLNMNNKEDSEYTRSLKRFIDNMTYRAIRPYLHSDFIFYNLTKNGPSSRDAVRKMHEYSHNVIENRINELKTKELNSDKKHMALLDSLIKAKNEGKIDLDGINEEINTFMFGGHDTSSVSLGFTLMLLANNQSIQQQIVDEINEIMPDPSEELTIKMLNDMKYLERCLKESMRLFPPVAFISRTLKEDLVTSVNFKIPKGTIVAIHIFDVHRDPKTYPNPEKYDPDRFLPENVQARHPYAYIPFSAGPRSCIGQKFAMLEMKIAVIDILRKFKLEAVDTPDTLQLYGQAVVRSRNGIKVKFIKRTCN